MAKRKTALVPILPDGLKKGITPARINEIESAFKESSINMAALSPEFDDIIAMKPSSVRSKQAKKLRLKYVKIRTGADKVGKPLKAVALAVGNYIDLFRNGYKKAADENEAILKQIEDYEALQKAKEEGAISKDRQVELEKLEINVFPANLGSWPEEVWTMYLAGVRAAYDKAREVIPANTIVTTSNAREVIPAPKANPSSAAKLSLESVNFSGATDDVILKTDADWGRSNSISDADKAADFALRLKELRFRYNFLGEKYTEAYIGACERFERMETYFTNLNKK